MKCAVRLCLIVTSEDIFIKSHQHGHLTWVEKGGHKQTGQTRPGKAQKTPNHAQSTISRSVNLGPGEVSLPREEHTKFVFHAKPLVLDTHTSNIIWTQQVIFGNIYVCTNTYSYETAIAETETMNLKKSGQGYRGGFGESKGKGQML